MKMTLVGMRDNRRVIYWPGVLSEGLIIVALSLMGYFAFQQIFRLFGGALPLLPGVIFAATIPLATVLGLHTRCAWRMPLDKLPKLR
jgi:hypothetical protein